MEEEDGARKVAYSNPDVHNSFMTPLGKAMISAISANLLLKSTNLPKVI
jgi:hypothetical protein